MSGWAKRLIESRFRIATQLYLGLGGAVALTIVATLVGWFFFDRVSDLQSRVNEGSVPEMAAAFGVAQLSGTLVAAAPRLTAAATPADFAQTATEIAEDRQVFEAAVADLHNADEERFARIRDRGGALTANLAAIEDSVAKRFLLGERGDALLAEIATLQKTFNDLLIPAIDDQLFYAMTGYRALGAPPSPRDSHLSEAEFARYRHLAGLQANATIAIQLLTGAFNISDAPLLEPSRERFESAVGKIERSLAAVGTGALRDRLGPAFARLVELGLGTSLGFDLRAQEIALARRQSDLLTRNRELAIELVAEAEGLVDAASANAEEATHASTQAILTGRNLLLALSVISVVGAVLIAWLFIGRVLLRRLARLSERMRRMAGGDLEAEVDIRGRDEVSDMAAALEVFRRHALEVQRLNLVEKLADELKGKNAQLEDALASLHRAQDQIVMREKLAALGELTAGVAHEIRNPLNFVKNFSEVSEELLEELLEELQAARESDGKDEKEDEKRRALIDEITSDLTGNLKRIREHGERANQIVQHMLAMGRGSGERQPTNINALLDEHARLAYHSARANDPDFQLRIEHDLDPALGELDVMAQDLGRVFLNMVGNACYAVDERRRAAEAADEGDGERYEPTVTLATKRAAENVEIRIRDNGNGIPPDVVDKIFNPFFTTKPTDQGTGLGLALSSDIVRQHGGEIRVESEPGAFTEMIVILPLTPPPASADEDEENTAEDTVSVDADPVEE